MPCGHPAEINNLQSIYNLLTHGKVRKLDGIIYARDLVFVECHALDV